MDLARRDDAATVQLRSAGQTRVLGVAAAPSATFSVLSIIMLDYSLPATRRLGNAPGVTSWDWMDTQTRTPFWGQNKTALRYNKAPRIALFRSLASCALLWTQ